MAEFVNSGRRSSAAEPVSWTRFEWKSGTDTYSFVLSNGGMFGTLSAPGGRELTLPVVVWEGLFDAVKVNGKAKAVADKNLPARSGARWTEAEIVELEKKFNAGESIETLARTHARTVWAIEGQLAKSGLWDRVERRPILDAPVDYARHETPAQGPSAQPASAAHGTNEDWRKEFDGAAVPSERFSTS